MIRNRTNLVNEKVGIVREATSFTQSNAQRECIAVGILVDLRGPRNHNGRRVSGAVQQVRLQHKHWTAPFAWLFLMGLGFEISQPYFSLPNGSQGHLSLPNPSRR
jgi:hypothetical protein